MDEQELFERWYLNESILNVVNKTPSGLAASPDDIYVDSYTRRAWAAWRAGRTIKMTEPKITTDYVNPPIPVRSYDWCAQYADCEGYYAGWGGTKEAAIADLKCRYAHLWEDAEHSTTSNTNGRKRP